MIFPHTDAIILIQPIPKTDGFHEKGEYALKDPKLLKGWFRKLLRRRLFILLLILLQFCTVLYYLFDRSVASEVVRNLLQTTSLFVALHIISKRTKEAYKLTWVFVILVFPVFGGLFYLLFRYQTRSGRLRRAEEEVKRTVSLMRHDRAELCEQAMQELPAHARQIEYLEKYSGYPIYRNTAAEHLSPGEDFLSALLPDLEKAESYIYIESFIIEEGEMWDTVYAILKKKAADGVDVRLIYDDMGCFLRLPLNFAKKTAADGIRCMTFNRFVPVLNAVQNYRDHRKIIAIDGRVAYTGGLNLADEYINRKQPFGHWKDTGVRLEGEGAYSLALIFLENWLLIAGASEKKSPLPSPPASKITNVPAGYVIPFADSPIDDENVTDHVYTQMITRANRYLYITTPYLIVDNSMVSALCTAAKSGVDIRIITPHRWDKRIVHFTTRSYYRELLKAGIRIYEYTPGFIHSKTFVSDDETAVIGTANMDFRSLYLQFECGVWMYRTDAVSELRDDFIKTLDVCREITPRDCRCNALVRFLQDVCRLFAPLM